MRGTSNPFIAEENSEKFSDVCSFTFFFSNRILLRYKRRILVAIANKISHKEKKRKRD
jgi:hypothetical protein